MGEKKSGILATVLNRGMENEGNKELVKLSHELDKISLSKERLDEMSIHDYFHLYKYHVKEYDKKTTQQIDRRIKKVRNKFYKADLEQIFSERYILNCYAQYEITFVFTVPYIELIKIKNFKEWYWANRRLIKEYNEDNQYV